MRENDPRIGGRFWSVDPLTQKYPWYSPYQFAGNKPVWKVDVDGMEEEGEEGKEAEADEIEKDQEKEESQARLRNALKTPTAEEQAKNRKETEEWLRKSPEERAKEGVRSFFQNLRNGAKNYGQNALNAAQGVLGGPILSTDPQWQVHEEGVYNDLLKNNPQGQFGKQITLDVYNKNGQMETIRGDILFKSPGSQMYELVDAKYSSVKDLTNVNLKSTLTESQQAAYEWIKTGQAAVIIPRGGNGAQLNFAPGVPIKVSPQIKIAVNVPQTPQNQAQYGARGILYRNY
jgi:hypothetical protein